MVNSGLHKDQDTCPISSETLEDRQQGSRASPSEHHPAVFEDTSSESVATPRSVLLVPSKTTSTTDLIDICLHSWSPLRHQVTHVSNIATTPTSA